MPDYKYQKKLEALPSCPPTAIKTGPRVCYRWVKSPLSPDHFLPVTLENTQRGFSENQQCNAWGLSLWDSSDQAKERFVTLSAKYKKFRGKWTHVAKLSLTSDHGAHSTSSSEGHFTLFEYVGIDLSTIAQIVGSL